MEKITFDLPKELSKDELLIDKTIESMIDRKPLIDTSLYENLLDNIVIEDIEEEQVIEEQFIEEQVIEEQVIEEQVIEEQVIEEQVIEEQVIDNTCNYKDEILLEILLRLKNLENTNEKLKQRIIERNIGLNIWDD